MDTKKRSVLVLDSKYYTSGLPFGARGVNPPELVTINENNSVGNSYINGINTGNKASYPLIVSDEELCSLWSNSFDSNTSHYNCDIWMQYSNQYDTTPSEDGGPILGVPCVSYCRNLYIPELDCYCDLPNMQTAMVIKIERKYLNLLDHGKVWAQPRWATANRSFMTSSKCDNTGGALVIGSYSRLSQVERKRIGDLSYFVIPIIELD